MARPDSPRIDLPKAARDAIAGELAGYVQRELGAEISPFDAVFLLDFILKIAGPHIYNQGLADAQAVVAKKTDEIGEAIYQLERPVKL